MRRYIGAGWPSSSLQSMAQANLLLAWHIQSASCRCTWALRLQVSMDVMLAGACGIVRVVWCIHVLRDHRPFISMAFFHIKVNLDSSHTWTPLAHRANPSTPPAAEVSGFVAHHRCTGALKYIQEHWHASLAHKMPMCHVHMPSCKRVS